MSEIERVDALVIGAGVVGLAVARELALAGREVLLLEAEDTFGTQVSSRNSEVIHAGIYYPPASLKARLCVEGRQLLYAYCQQRGIAHQRIGKLVVAENQEGEQLLDAIAQRARQNGVLDLQALSGRQAQQMEPQLRCTAALLSPSTGILDVHELMLALLGDLENAGGTLATHAAVTSVEASPTGLCVHLAGELQGMRLQARSLVNAAGLGAPELAYAMPDLPDHCRPARIRQWAKGSYFSFSGPAPFRHLIYPAVPADGGSLGIHFTLDLGGQGKFGPDLQWVESPEDWQVDETRAEHFYMAVRRYWPALPDGSLQPGYAGIRPKLVGPGAPAADFWVQGPADHGVPGLVNLLGIESPGLTSCLALARHVHRLLQVSPA